MDHPTRRLDPADEPELPPLGWQPFATGHEAATALDPPTQRPDVEEEWEPELPPIGEYQSSVTPFPAAPLEPEHLTRRLDSPILELRCAKCNGETMWAEAGTFGAPRVEFRRLRGTHTLFNPQYYVTPCHVLICTICGFAELYARQPQDLLEDPR